MNASRLLIATGNEGKVKELRALLGATSLALYSLNDFPRIGTVEETGSSYAENALLKARFYADESGVSALADDSGLEVAALGGAPGLFSARYAGPRASDEARRQFLIAELRSKQIEESAARFVCAIAICHPDGSIWFAADGECSGRIITDPRGNKGFGYDPLFMPDGYDMTFAELEEGVKNKISHRARALVKVKQFFESNRG